MIDSNPSQAIYAHLPMVVTEVGIVTASSISQQRKVKSLIKVIDSGITTETRRLQLLNALVPMALTESGISILFKEWQSSNAFFPMEVTEFYMSTDFIFSQERKALSQKDVTPFCSTAESMSFPMLYQGPFSPSAVLMVHSTVSSPLRELNAH